MGLFDGLKAAFANEEFKEDDQRVRASHILVKGDDDVDKIAAIFDVALDLACPRPRRRLLLLL